MFRPVKFTRLSSLDFYENYYNFHIMDTIFPLEHVIIVLSDNDTIMYDIMDRSMNSYSYKYV